MEGDAGTAIEPQDDAMASIVAWDSVVAYVATRDAPCPACGYNLRAAPTRTCPECAHRATIRELTRPGPLRRAAEFTALIGFWVLVDLSLVTFALVASEWILADPNRTGAGSLAICALLILASGLAIELPRRGWNRVAFTVHARLSPGGGALKAAVACIVAVMLAVGLLWLGLG